MPPLGHVEQLVQPMFINAAHQQMPSPFCADGTHTIQFLNGSVSIVGRPLPPLCLTVVAVDHRPHQQTPAGPLPVTNVVLRNGDGQRVEASAWQQQAGALAALNIGSTYWFTNCTARARYQQLDCWYRIGVNGKNAIVVPHTAAPESTAPQSDGLHHPFASTLGGQATAVQTGAGRTVNQTRVPPAAGPVDDENNNTIDHRFGVPIRARLPQRRAAQLVGLRATRPIEDCFVIERTTPMRNTLRNTKGELCEIRFLPLEDAQRPDLVLETLIQHLLDRVLEGHPPPMLVGLQLHPPGFDRPYVIRLRPPEQNNASALAAAIERLNEQSAAGIDLLAGTTVTKVLAVWPLEPIRADAQRGGGCDFDAEHHVSNTMQSLVRVVNPNDRHCLARAVLLGLRDRETRQPNGGGRDAFAAYAGRQDEHGAQAMDLLRNAGLPVDKQMYTLEDVQQLQQWINNMNGIGQIRLVVFEKEQEYRIVFKGDGMAARFNLCLLLEHGHFNYVGRIEQLFKDSINYFFCELDALVKSFDLPQHLATVKPFFPYLYIQRQHLLQRLNGLPSVEHYAPDTMKVEKRAKFLRWHGENNNNNANFQLREQLILYCVNDVAILRESVLRFRQLIGEHTQGLDPFLCASTAAGLALATLRRCFLPANRLVHSPEGGYLRGRRASAESRRYIRFFELENEGAQVQCADWSIGEAHIEDSGYRVDGFWRRDPPLRPLAIEWMGCFYHGCPDCFPDRQQKLAAGRTAEDLYERTMRRLFELEHQHGCELHVIWGCQWKERLRRDHELKQRYEAVFTPCPLDPRNDALRGGRTEPFKLHHVCADDEEVLCIDIVSLYPYVMKVNPFPVGNPMVLTREVLLHPPTAPLPWTCPENNTFRGLLLVRVLAPRNIRVPLLGYRTKDERFTFPLCGVCADRRQQRPCRHDDDKRSWVCAYTHVELNKALQLGYVVTDLFEVWDYAEWDDTLFSSYVNSFVGLKVQASGWPEGCDTEEQRQAFVAEFLRTEGIHLDPTKVAFNPGLRLIAKTLANSLWGKLAQRVGHTEIQYTRTPAEFHKLLDDPTYDKLDFVHVSDHMDRVVVRKRPEFAKAPLTNCLPVAIFVTSYARLHLYGYMEQVLAMNNAELLYCDTDSIYYVNKIGAPCVPEGEALGQMKREHVDRRIVEFVAGGPKNYGIRHTARDGTDERANLKIRSFRLSYATQQLINFDAMKELTLSTYNIDGPIDDVIDNDDLFIYGGGAHRAIRVSFPQIDRNIQADLFTREAHKDYRPFYAKGRVRPGMQTRPFGYVEDAPQPMNVEQHAQPPPPPPVRRKRTLIEADPNQPGHS
ncbi:hypothetical protein niasHT_031232 [Heterodera trifolii]|uniref:DNA-directed DNA polymerase n=1 Tax=Heterodera trifolii TaxID=157864 RepID=A0ABD2IHF4_9BILA